MSSVTDKAIAKVEVEHLKESDSRSKLSHNSLDGSSDPELPPLLSRKMIPLLLVCGLIYFNSTNSGFDGSLMSSIYTQEDFMHFFGTDPKSSSSTGLLFAIFNVGYIASSFFCPLSDIIGRKKVIIGGSFGVIVGAIITTVAQNKSTLIAGRFILSFFTTQTNTAASIYCVEIAISSHRSRVAGCYNTLWYLGSILAAFTAYGANIHHAGTETAFRLPLGMQALCPGIVFIGAWFVPESPRWLVGMGKVEQAKKIIAKYHCGNDLNDPLIDYEIAEMIDSFSQVGLTKGFEAIDPRPMFKNNNTYRSLLVICMAWMGQFSGNNVCSYYLPTMMEAVGMTSVSVNILLNAMYSLVSWFASICGAFAHEGAGRRKVLMGSMLAASLCLSALAISTARFQATGNDNASRSSIAMVFLFGVSFSFGFTPMQPIYPAEVTSNSLRSRSMVFLNLTAGVAGFVNQYASPEAMANIGYWFYVFYSLWNIVQLAVIYFFFVETRGYSLEEMDLIFAAKRPVKASIGDYSHESPEWIELNQQRKKEINEIEQNVHAIHIET